MHTDREAPASARYEDDFYAWTVAQAAAVRDGRWTDIDVENLVEEIDTLGKSDKREIRSRLRVMLTHVLKQSVQPERATTSWQRTIAAQASEIHNVLDDSPSLERSIPDMIAWAYPHARRDAAAETRLPLKRFPESLTPDIEAKLRAALADAGVTL